MTRTGPLSPRDAVFPVLSLDRVTGPGGPRAPGIAPSPARCNGVGFPALQAAEAQAPPPIVVAKTTAHSLFTSLPLQPLTRSQGSVNSTE